jgi:hypothetical protein
MMPEICFPKSFVWRPRGRPPRRLEEFTVCQQYYGSSARRDPAVLYAFCTTVSQNKNLLSHHKYCVDAVSTTLSNENSHVQTTSEQCRGLLPTAFPLPAACRVLRRATMRGRRCKPRSSPPTNDFKPGPHFRHKLEDPQTVVQCTAEMPLLSVQFPRVATALHYQSPLFSSLSHCYNAISRTTHRFSHLLQRQPRNSAQRGHPTTRWHPRALGRPVPASIGQCYM